MSCYNLSCVLLLVLKRSVTSSTFEISVCKIHRNCSKVNCQINIIQQSTASNWNNYGSLSVPLWRFRIRSPSLLTPTVTNLNSGFIMWMIPFLFTAKQHSPCSSVHPVGVFILWQNCQCLLRRCVHTTAVVTRLQYSNFNKVHTIMVAVFVW